jgi:hypothetical protein
MSFIPPKAGANRDIRAHKAEMAYYASQGLYKKDKESVEHNITDYDEDIEEEIEEFHDEE